MSFRASHWATPATSCSSTSRRPSSPRRSSSTSCPGFLTEPELVRAAFYNVAVGLAGAAFDIVTGLVDYLGMVPRSRKHRVTTWHLLLNVPVVLLFALSLGLRAPELDAARTPVYILVISALALPALVVGNYLGGELVYRVGIRVNTGRLPQTPLLLRVVGMVQRRLKEREPV